MVILLSDDYHFCVVGPHVVSRNEMLSKLADWSSLIGLAIGIAGLAYSVLAFKAAKKARQSADAARRDVRTLVASDKFHNLGSRASELFSHVQHEKLQVAVFLARDLRFEINNAITRWEFLDTATKERFREASRLAMQIAEFMWGKNELDAREKTKLLRRCDRISSILSGESGKIQSVLEVRGE